MTPPSPNHKVKTMLDSEVNSTVWLHDKNGWRVYGDLKKTYKEHTKKH